MCAAIKAEMGLDKPFYIEYFENSGNVMKGDLGKSFVTEKFVFPEFRKVGDRLLACRNVLI